jgi:hypothetical protein
MRMFTSERNALLGDELDRPDASIRHSLLSEVIGLQRSDRSGSSVWGTTAFLSPVERSLRRWVRIRSDPARAAGRAAAA